MSSASVDFQISLNASNDCSQIISFPADSGGASVVIAVKDLRTCVLV